MKTAMSSSFYVMASLFDLEFLKLVFFNYILALPTRNVTV